MLKASGFIVLCGALVFLTGCAGGIYSTQNFGPDSVSGSTISEVIEANGPPDVVGGNDQYMTLTYYHTEGMQVLGLFAHVSKKPVGVVIDENGKVVARGSGKEGKGLAILGSVPVPVFTVETK